MPVFTPLFRSDESLEAKEGVSLVVKTLDKYVFIFLETFPLWFLIGPVCVWVWFFVVRFFLRDVLKISTSKSCKSWVLVTLSLG